MSRPAARRRRRIAIAAALFAALVCAFVLPGLQRELVTVTYTVRAQGMTGRARLALLTDFHSNDYGEGADELLRAVEAAAPDLVLLVGDIIDDELPEDRAEALLAGLAARWPCRYVTGNHEFQGGNRAFDRRMAILARCGIPRLRGEAVTVAAGTAVFALCGVDDPDGTGPFSPHDEDVRSYDRQLSDAKAQAEPGLYTVLMAHRPERVRLYADMGYDLVLSGHAHGGQWRVPGLINGVFAPYEGLFPRYAGGLYRVDGTTMVVSRGLDRETTVIPRLYNPPELVIVELVGDDAEVTGE